MFDGSVKGGEGRSVNRLDDLPKGLPHFLNDVRGCSSEGRAPAWHAGGHRFDSGHLHQIPVSTSKVVACTDKDVCGRSDMPAPDSSPALFRPGSSEARAAAL